MIKSPNDPDALKRILDHLASVGWIEKMAVADKTPQRPGQVHVEFSEKGKAHISAFKRLHDELGDIAEDDRKFLYEFLIRTIISSMEKRKP